MKNNGLKPEINHAEIEEAMKFFYAKGGKVKVLPAQKFSSVTVVGADKWTAYETIGELRF